MAGSLDFECLCAFVVNPASSGLSAPWAYFQDVDHVHQPAENLIHAEQEDRHEEHKGDHNLGRTNQLAAAGPVDLLHFAIGRDQKVGVGRLIEHPPAEYHISNHKHPGHD